MTILSSLNNFMKPMAEVSTYCAMADLMVLYYLHDFGGVLLDYNLITF